LARNFENAIEPQITLGCGGCTDTNGFAGGENVRGAGVGFRIYCYRSNSEAIESADYSAGYFTAIGNQNFVKHLGNW
jgi:hypothetical protein